MHTRAALLLCMTVGIAACVPRSARPTTSPAAPALASPADLSVLLTWSTPVDLDLYLTEPSSETVYFANNPSRSGARLVRDARCADTRGQDSLVEQIVVPAPRPGVYRVGVDFIDACGGAGKPVSYRVVVDLAGTRRQVTGTIQLEQFLPIVLEFPLTSRNHDGSVVLSREEEP